MKLTRSQVQEVVDYLQGNCVSIGEALYTLFETSQADLENELEFCDYLDGRLFLCCQCGWWYEVGDWTDYGSKPEDARNEEYCTSCGQENGWIEGV